MVVAASFLEKVPFKGKGVVFSLDRPPLMDARGVTTLPLKNTAHLRTTRLEIRLGIVT